MSIVTHNPVWFNYPKYNWKKKHAVVIGAGIAGCQITWHLVKQGWKVTLIEREKKIARHASGNPAGIISPKMTAHPSNGEDFYVDCFEYAIDQLNSLKNNYSKLDWNACGLLQLAHNKREEQRWNSLKARAFNKTFFQCVEQDQSSEIAGIPINYKASYFPQAGWINPVSFCETLIADCGDNCELILETDAITLEKQEKTRNVISNVTWNIISNVTRQQTETIASAEVVIVTSGKDLNQFQQTNQLPALPVAGQTTTAVPNEFSKQLKTTIGHEGYLTPTSESTSYLTFGASFDRDFQDLELNPHTDKINLAQLSEYLPQLANSFIEINSSHKAARMTTPDRFPYFGGIADSAFYAKNYSDLHQGKQYKEYPEAKYEKGLFVLAGLGSRGLTTSGLCAKVLSDIINNKVFNENITIQQHCHPARFIIKDLKRNKKIK